MFTDFDVLVGVLALVVIGIGIAGLIVVWHDVENDEDADYTL
jgi:uncharacterized membrane protein